MPICGEPSSRGPIPTAGALRLLTWLAPCLLLWGCQGAGVKVGPEQRAELERRATDLLLRAAQSEDPLVCSNALEALVQVAPEDGLPRFRLALRSPSPLVRFAGLVALGTVRDKPSRPSARPFLADSHPLVRLAAAFALYRYGETERARVLVDALREHPDENVRAEAAHLIGLLEEPRAVKQLKAALSVKANQGSQKVLVHIYSALARLGDADAVRALIDYAQGSPATRLLALQGLVEVGAEEAREALLYRMGPDEDYLIHRLIAARGLAKLGADIGYDLALQNTKYVGKNPEDPEEAMRVRSNAALVLGELGDPRALPALKELAETDHDPLVQTAACCAICRIVNRADQPPGRPSPLKP
jgi:HEAT repeat protein